MAYIRKIFSTDEKWSGPFPHKAGEFCGNAQMKDLTVDTEGFVLKRQIPLSVMIDGDFDDLDSGPTQRIGAPSKTLKFSSESMANQGMVGLYSLFDSKLLTGSIEVDTDILTEDVVSGKRPSLKPFNPGVPMENHERIA